MRIAKVGLLLIMLNGGGPISHIWSSGWFVVNSCSSSP